MENVGACSINIRRHLNVPTVMVRTLENIVRMSLTSHGKNIMIGLIINDHTSIQKDIQIMVGVFSRF